MQACRDFSILQAACFGIVLRRIAPAAKLPEADAPSHGDARLRAAAQAFLFRVGSGPTAPAENRKAA